MERTIFLGSDRTTFEVGSLWAVRSFRLVGPKCPFRLTRLLYDPEYRPFVSCSQEQQPNVRWLGSGLCDGDVTFHWVHRWSSEVLKFLHRNFCWMERVLVDFTLLLTFETVVDFSTCYSWPKITGCWYDSNLTCRPLPEVLSLGPSLLIRWLCTAHNKLAALKKSFYRNIIEIRFIKEKS